GGGFAGGSDEPHETGVGTCTGRSAGASRCTERFLRAVAGAGDGERHHVFAVERIGCRNYNGVCFAAGAFDGAGNSCWNWDRGGAESAGGSSSGDGVVLGHHGSGHV